MNKDEVIALIRDVPDFPKPGILFKDITPLLQNADAFYAVVETFVERYKNRGITKVVGVESRGFLFGAVVAYRLGAGFVPVRKPGKLPWLTYSESYDLEYGSDTLELHQDALNKNDVVLIHDDLLATGGTMGAVINLVRRTSATINEISFVLELSFLEGRKNLESLNVKVSSYVTI